MTAIRDYQRVHGNKIEVTLPDEFEDMEVEIIVLAKDNLPDDLSHLNEAVRIGMESPISSKSHESFMEELQAKYAD